MLDVRKAGRGYSFCVILSVVILLGAFSCKSGGVDVVTEYVTVAIWDSMQGQISSESLLKGQSVSFSLDRSGYEQMAALYQNDTLQRYVEGGSLTFTPADGHRIILFPNNDVYQAWKDAGHANFNGPTLAHGTNNITVSRQDFDGQTMPESIWFNGGQTIKYTDANGVEQDSGLYAVFDQINSAIDGIGSVSKVDSGATFTYGAGDCTGEGGNDHYSIVLNFDKLVTGVLDTKAEIIVLVTRGLSEVIENITAINNPDGFIGYRGAMTERDKIGLRWVFYKGTLTTQYTNSVNEEWESTGTEPADVILIMPGTPGEKMPAEQLR